MIIIGIFGVLIAYYVKPNEAQKPFLHRIGLYLFGLLLIIIGLYELLFK